MKVYHKYKGRRTGYPDINNLKVLLSPIQYSVGASNFVRKIIYMTLGKNIGTNLQLAVIGILIER